LRQPAASSSAPHPLDRALFWLRWVFIGSVVVLALADDALLDGVIIDRMRLFGALAIAALGNLALGGLALSKRLSDRVLGGLDVLFDSALAGLFLWVYEGVGLPLLLLGTLAIFDAAFRFRWRGIAITLTLLSLATLAATSRLTALPQTRATYLGFTLIFLAILGVLGAVLRSGGWSWRRRALDELESEAIRLRTTRERTRAIYELANTISASLDYRRVLEAAQDTGELLLSNDDGQRARVVSAALLFQGAEDKLRVVSSRHLTRSDEQVEIEGQRGILGLALKQAEPVFAGEALHDPELRYFAGFQDAKSLLVIPLRSGFEHYGVLVFGCDKPNAFSEEHAELLSAIGTQATLSLQNAVLYQTLLNEKEKIVEVEEDARKKLSRDLHDGPTQSVAAIAMRVNYIRRLIERQPQQAIEELWKVEELARRTTKEIRHMLFTLRPLVLESQGLAAALEQLAEKMRDTHGVEVALQTQPDVEMYLDTHAQGVLFYIIEEAVNNARKHAQAQQITVRLSKHDAYVLVEVEDNGVGFDVDEVTAGYDRRGSLGLINMRERAELIEGNLRIQSAPGHGTRISVMIPLRAGTLDNPAAAPPLELRGRRARDRAARNS
jgi:signal transduction histidine kinase